MAVKKHRLTPRKEKCRPGPDFSAVSASQHIKIGSAELGERDPQPPTLTRQLLQKLAVNQAGQHLLLLFGRDESIVLDLRNG